MSDTPAFKYVEAQAVKQGYTIPNVGYVLSVGNVGVFVVMRVIANRPSLADGTISVVPTDYVRHSGDEILITNPR